MHLVELLLDNLHNCITSCAQPVIYKHSAEMLATITYNDTVYCKLFEVEKFRGFRRSISKWKTFTVKHFYLVLKMAGHGPGSSLKNSCMMYSQQS